VLASTVLQRVPAVVLDSIAARLVAKACDEVALEPGAGRGYRRLLHTEAYEAWLIAWRPGADLALHDHGGSIGTVSVVYGELLERATDRLAPGPLRTARVQAHRPLAIGPTRIHGLWNPGPAPALSVHVYAPPLATMTFYDPLDLSPQRTVDVEGPG
jgi:predicted metal-dependent enzyme (double-stranded beta helix superfamily)